MTKNIVFYSNFCDYSKSVVEKISKTPINQNIMYVCVDDENIQLPNFITAVPTVYLVEKKRIVVDEDILSWIDEQINENNKPKELKAYYGENDSGFGACFSNLDNSESKPFISSSFTFIGDEQSITTPSEDGSMNSNNNMSSKSGLTNEYEKLQASRNNDFTGMQRR